MNIQSFNILVVDDDKTFGESVKSALSRAGFRAYFVATPQDAMAYVKLQDVHGLVIDCMLPKMNGLELYKKLKDHLHGDPAVALMSGIFKDRQFINSSVKSTGAIQFFCKPFDVQEMVTKFKTHFGASGGPAMDLSPLVELYMSRNFEKPRNLIRTINSCEGLHNFDLLWVFSVLSAAKVSGHLNIACTNGDIAGVGFLEGQIVQVNIKNEESLLGLLLVDHGFLDREDLDVAVTKMSENNRIGQILVESNYVSPHAIDIVLKDQLMWRLKRLISDSQMELNFVSSKQVTAMVTINHRDNQEFYAETLEQVVREDWLKTHYLPLMQNIVGINKDSEVRLNSLKHTPFVSRIYSLLATPLQNGTTLDELLGQHPDHESAILKVMHFLNLNHCLRFTEVAKNSNLTNQVKRLTRLKSELETKNYFERIGVSRSAKDADIKKAYFDLAKVLHPDKLPDGTTDEVRELSAAVFQKIQIAYDTLKKQDRKEIYLRELEVGHTEKIIQADQSIEKAKFLLLKGDYKKAEEQLVLAKKLNPSSIEMLILMVWCDIKRTKSPSDSFIEAADKRLQKVPPQSRDTAVYYHTRGLYSRMIGDVQKASKYFKTALSRDASFINSRRELTSLGGVKEKTNIFQADLKDVMGMLFKKR